MRKIDGIIESIPLFGSEGIEVESTKPSLEKSESKGLDEIVEEDEKSEGSTELATPKRRGRGKRRGTKRQMSTEPSTTKKTKVSAA